MVDSETYDKYRYIELTIDSWIYYIDEPSVKVQPATNRFPYEGVLPFSNNRKDWRAETIEIIIARLTQAMINEFGNRGICAPSNEPQCSPSINWDYEIISALFDYTSGCPQAVIDSYKRIQKRITENNKKYNRLEKEKNEIQKKDELTSGEIRKIRDLTNQMERLLRTISGDENQLLRFKEECPNIDEII